jgi:CAAX protease family protein
MAALPSWAAFPDNPVLSALTVIIELSSGKNLRKDTEMNSVETSLRGTKDYSGPPTLVGVGLALLGPFIFQWFIGPYFEAVAEPVPAVLLGLGFLWLLVLSVIVITLYWERQPLTSLGIRSLTLRLVLFGIGLGLLLSVALPLLEIFANQLFPASQGGAIQDTIINKPVWLWLTIILTASVTEEVLFRAYPLERLTSLTGNKWLAAILSLAAFVLFHTKGIWSTAHVLGAVLPMGAILTALYMWRRNLPFVILMHFLIDLPLVLIAAGILPAL